jgi:thiamine biosynthesis lipoprotein
MTPMRNRALHASLTLLLAALVSACAAQAGKATEHLVERSRASMGSDLRLTAWTADDVGAVAAFDAVFREFDRLEDLMSVWREGSDIARLNVAAGDHPVSVSPDVREALTIAHQVSDWTGGTFDVTFGVLSGLWKFDYQDKDSVIPDRSEVLKRLSLINYRDLEVDDQAGTAFLRRKGMRVNLGGIGKGYAVDRAVEILRQRGLRDFMIQAGGDMYVAGRRGIVRGGSASVTREGQKTGASRNSTSPTAHSARLATTNASS